MTVENKSMPSDHHADQAEGVFLCNRDGTILKVIAIRPGFWPELSEGHSLLQYFESEKDFTEKWRQAAELGESFLSEVIHKPRVDQAVKLQAGVNSLSSQVPESGVMLAMFSAAERSSLETRTQVAQYQAIMETAVDAIITIQTDGKILSVNPATCRMFGYLKEELIGLNISILMPAPYKDEHDGYLKKYLQTGKAAIIGVGRRVTGLKRDGIKFPIHLAVTEYSIGKERFFSGIIRDLSELERVQQQLLQSARLAAIGQMVTGLAHESRNALQRAQACLDMLSLELEGQPDLRDLARRATVALKDLHRLYEEVRSYAAPIHLELRDCHLNTIWRKEWDNLEAVRGGHGIALEEELSCERTVCEVDVHRMEQVFRNILENAVYACGDSGCVHVHCSPTVLNDAPAVKIVISDDGTGLTPEAAEKIFEPFFTTKQKGTGLGMAIVRRIMEAHSGEVTAVGTENVGSQITLVLPVKPSLRNGFRTVPDLPC